MTTTSEALFGSWQQVGDQVELENTANSTNSPLPQPKYEYQKESGVSGLSGAGSVMVSPSLTFVQPEAVPMTCQIQFKAAPFKYNEPELLRQLGECVAGTYGQHYVGSDNVQSMDLIFSGGHADGFCVGNVIKYALRYGKKGGYNRDDLMKVLHYGLLLLHNHDKQGR